MHVIAPNIEIYDLQELDVRALVRAMPAGLPEKLGYTEDRSSVRYQRALSLILRHFVLARVLGVHPQDLKFEKQPEGKPVLTGRDLLFNVSHTARYWAVAYCAFEEGIKGLGLDIEQRRGKSIEELRAIARRYFHEDEYAFLESMTDPALWVDRFYDLWTKKEALAKAGGEGLAATLARIDVASGAGLENYGVVSLDFPHGPEREKLYGALAFSLAAGDEKKFSFNAEVLFVDECRSPSF